MRILNDNRTFDVEVNLPGSKSESNRALMICYYGGFAPDIQYISQADDTLLLRHVLSELKYGKKIVDCGNAGTVCRFVLTALTMRDTDSYLIGSERMRKRPIGSLVNALISLGAEIEYCKSDGYLPLSVHGKKMEGGDVNIDASESSQFVSSLLLAAPVIRAGLNIHLEGDTASLPYIDMTIDVMRKYGAGVKRVGKDIFVEGKGYENCRYVVEPDWSAASYWYEVVAFSRGGRVLLKNLDFCSSQGDSVLPELFRNFGVSSSMIDGGVSIHNDNTLDSNTFRYDFTDNPDLFPAVAATCAGLQVEAVFEGLGNLSIKESDRVAAIMTELSKIGVEMRRDSVGTLVMSPLEAMPSFTEASPIFFDSHDDHRIAMALAPLAMMIGAVEIDNAGVVSKSYPDFFNELGKVFQFPT
ncbi:MAG: 3-phosphoshikimate 1-carboxyvinyltransferase [Candidatus Limimorpha sp.]